MRGPFAPARPRPAAARRVPPRFAPALFPPPVPPSAAAADAGAPVPPPASMTAATLATAPPPVVPATEQETGFGGGGLLTMLVVFVPLYVVLMFVLPNRGKKKGPVELKRNDRVATTGGLIGTVAVAPAADDAEVTVKFGDARIPVLRTHIAQVLTPPDAAKADGKTDPAQDPAAAKTAAAT